MEHSGHSPAANSQPDLAVAHSATYDVVGLPNTPRIVLLHGVAFTRAMWQPQIEVLSDEFRVVALDLPGHGALADEPFRLDSAVAQVAGIIDATGKDAVLVGLSLGGYVAMAYAHAHSERVRGIILSSCCVDYRVWGRLSELDAQLVLRLIGAERVRRMQEKTLRGMLSPALAERQIAAGFSFEAMPQAYRELARHDFRRVLHSYLGPVLLLNGERDRPNRRGERRMLAAAQHGMVRTIPNAGHPCNLEQPAQFNAAVREFMQAIARDKIC